MGTNTNHSGQSTTNLSPEYHVFYCYFIHFYFNSVIGFGSAGNPRPAGIPRLKGKSLPNVYKCVVVNKQCSFMFILSVVAWIISPARSNPQNCKQLIDKEMEIQYTKADAENKALIAKRFGAMHVSSLHMQNQAKMAETRFLELQLQFSTLSDCSWKSCKYHNQLNNKRKNTDDDETDENDGFTEVTPRKQRSYPTKSIPITNKFPMSYRWKWITRYRFFFRYKPILSCQKSNKERRRIYFGDE